MPRQQLRNRMYQQLRVLPSAERRDLQRPHFRAFSVQQGNASLPSRCIDSEDQHSGS
jgi:hypothetical protein